MGSVRDPTFASTVVPNEPGHGQLAALPASDRVSNAVEWATCGGDDRAFRRLRSESA